jgi:4-hydroxybenzoyl-CoA thioesterase
LFEAAGLRKAEMLRQYGLVGIPLVEASGQFYAPASFGETVVVESRIVDWGTSSFRVEHKLFKGSMLTAEGREKRVWTVRDLSSEKGMRGDAVPEEVKARFR